MFVATVNVLVTWKIQAEKNGHPISDVEEP
jgi:hypothetical protein